MSDHRVALVTGAGRGIGAAVVDALVERGYTVAALDVCSGASTPPGVEYGFATPNDLAALVARHPDRVEAHRVDVTDAAALSDVVTDVVARHGRLDVAVAAAGLVVGGHPLWETPPEHLRTLMDTNVTGVWNTAAAVVPAMLSGPAPQTCRFVAVASAAGEHGLFHLTGYTVSKHAVIGIVRGLAADLTGTGVTAVAVSPGSTRTAMLEATAQTYGVGTDELVSHQRIGRVIEPEEIAEVVALCCEPAGAVLNGSVVAADGGFG